MIGEYGMEEKFKHGDRVYHKNLKQYGTFIDYAWEAEEECEVEFETEDGYIKQKHVSVNKLILATENSDFENGRKQLADHIQHQFKIGKPVEINGELYWLTDSKKHLENIMDDIENEWNKKNKQ